MDLRKIFQSQSEDPRKQILGTSYEAKGAVNPPSQALKEQGSARSPRIADVVPQLTTRSQELRVYAEMANGDATVDVALRAAKVPILAAKFFMQPFDDKQVNLDISEFCTFNLLEGLTVPFGMVMEDALRMFDDGFSVLESVFERREWAPRRSGANRKQYVMLDRLAYRPAGTISDVVYDDNGLPLSLKQQAIQGSGTTKEIEIPIDKLLIFSFNRRGTDIMGRSILRTAYQPWYFKNKLYLIDAIQKERNSLGVPVMEILEPGFTQTDVNTAWELVTSLRTNEKTGAVEPPGFKLRFEKPQGTPVDVMPSIDHHDGKILLNVMAQFLLMGMQQSGGGGRATSGAHVDMFQKAYKYIGNYICDVFNLYLIPKLVAYNFDTDEFPQLRVRNIGETKDMQMWASALANVFAQGIVTPDFETEQWAREQLDMPFKMGEEQTPMESKSQRGDVNTNDAQGGTGNTSTDPGAESVATG